MCKGKLSSTLQVVCKLRLLCADVPEHVSDARSPHVQAAIVLVRGLRTLLTSLHRLHQLPDSTSSVFNLSSKPESSFPKFSLHLQLLAGSQVGEWVLNSDFLSIGWFSRIMTYVWSSGGHAKIPFDK